MAQGAGSAAGGSTHICVAEVAYEKLGAERAVPQLRVREVEVVLSLHYVICLIATYWSMNYINVG